MAIKCEPSDLYIQSFIKHLRISAAIIILLKSQNDAKIILNLRLDFFVNELHNSLIFRLQKIAFRLSNERCIFFKKTITTT